MSLLALAAQFCLSLLLILLVSSFVFSLLYPLYRKILVAFEVNNSAMFTFYFASVSIAVTLMSVCLLYFPSLSEPFIFEHCHQGVCTPHSPDAVYSSYSGLALMAAAAIGVCFILTLIVKSLLNASRNLALLNQLATQKPKTHLDSDYLVIESKDVFAWCAGLLSPRIFVSRGMLDKTSPEQLNAVLAHERCHIEQRDNLRKFILHWTTLFWLPSYRRQVQSDFTQWAENYSNRYAKQQSSTNTKKCTGFIKQNLFHGALLSGLFIFSVIGFTSGSHLFIELIK